MSYFPSVDHLGIVKEYRARFPQAELSAEQCVQLVNGVAKRLRELGESAGLLEKTSGNNAYGYSVDYIAYEDGSLHCDCLMSSGYIPDQAGEDGLGPSTAQWLEHGPFDASRWRPPSDEIPDVPPGPAPGPEPEPPRFVCPQWTPINLEEAHEEARAWREIYVNTDRNPDHLEPSITDIQLWFWRRFIELWDPADIEAEIRAPGSTSGTFCKVLPAE